MVVKEEARKMKLASPYMAASSLELRNKALEKIIEALEENREAIFAENHADVEAAESAGVAKAVVKRLKFDENKLRDAIAGIRQMIGLPDPVGKVTLNRELDADLLLQRVTVPIGVIGVIFEARPDALIQISALCIKSGNCAILKGGKETARTNKILFGLVHGAAVAAGLPESCLLQVELHNEIDELLKCQGDVDLLIPRGSNKFVQYIMDNTNIPVMGHAAGICHIYLDEKADLAKSVPVIVDAKTQYPAVCNATETLLVNRKIAADALPVVLEALVKAGVKLRGSAEVAELVKMLAAAGKLGAGQGAAAGNAENAANNGAAYEVEIMGDEDFATEYTDLIISLKLVEDVAEAADHINKFGSHHTDCILTEDDKAAEYFLQMVDSAGVYRNCSTRFADGFRYGFGAEVGVSTGKLHARGPVGLEGLVTYKYRLVGNGQLVGDYVSGKKQFHHRDL
ncbi:MAG: glutamate-5-semialdehyde dehydrogenase [Lachnospiraceae bacterium]|nr:glutamate-5-semialdehyde dehydrogenase [Lachnospiraceae bacterium]